MKFYLTTGKGKSLIFQREKRMSKTAIQMTNVVRHLNFSCLRERMTFGYPGKNTEDGIYDKLV